MILQIQYIVVAHDGEHIIVSNFLDSIICSMFMTVIKEISTNSFKCLRSMIT